MKNDEQRTIKILCVLGIIPVVWLALLIAPAVSGGLPEILQHFPKAMETPFHIELCEDSQKTVLIFLLIYALSIGVALSSRRNYRRGEEHGSAKWGSATAVNKKYQAKDPEANKVFTKHVRMGLDGRKHRRNLNTVVVGGSGSGKSRFYALINLLQACSSYFVLDCKGELLRMTGTFLKMRGYEIKVLDLLSMEKSHCFNPFAYLQTDNDVQKLVTSLFKATTPKGSQSNDPFWDTAASMLLSAIIFYLLYEAPEEEQNFPMVMEMLRAGEVREDDDTYAEGNWGTVDEHYVATTDLENIATGFQDLLLQKTDLFEYETVIDDMGNPFMILCCQRNGNMFSLKVQIAEGHFEEWLTVELPKLSFEQLNEYAQVFIRWVKDYPVLSEEELAIAKEVPW